MKAISTVFRIIAAVSAALCICSCASHRMLCPDAPSISTLLNPDRGPKPFAGSGIIRCSFDKQRFQTRIDVRWRNDSEFTATIYDPFSQILAILGIDSAGAYIEQDDSRTALLDDKELSFPGFAVEYPFTFHDFVRIITGRLPSQCDVQRPPDSCYGSGARNVFTWRNDSLSTLIKTTGREDRIQRITCRNRGKEPWRVDYSHFRSAMPARIQFDMADADYCIFIYDQVRTIAPEAKKGK
jgi:hypothetical protein